MALNLSTVAAAGMASTLVAGAAVAEPVVFQHPQEIARVYARPDSPMASAVIVPAGATTIFLSGALPSIADTTAPSDSIAAYGDTETQTISTLNNIKARLEALGLGLGDVVSMTVYLVGVPESEGRMDFAGMMRGYRAFFGVEQQPNRPSRSTVQVTALAGPGFLVEIEVTASRVGYHAPE